MTQITEVAPGIPGTGEPSPAPVRLGVQFTRYPGREDRPLEDSLRAAIADGFGLAVLNSIAPELSGAVPDRLDAAADMARQCHIELQLGLGSAGPFGDPLGTRRELGRALARGLDLGIREFFVHTRSERAGASQGTRFLDHPAQLRIIHATLAALAPAALDAGARINVKTHEDLASQEVATLVQDLDPAVFGVGLDVANLVVRGEDPLEVAERLGPQTRMTHLEDLVLFTVEAGYRRRLRALGEGVLDWPEIIRLLLAAGVRDFTLEQHRGRFDTPVFDRAWFRTESHLDAPGLGQLALLAARTQEGVTRGSFPALDRWDEEPGPAERRRQLLHSAATLRDILRSTGAAVAPPATSVPREEGHS